MEPTISEVRLFAGNFPPRSWAFCNGQLLSISVYTPLFALIGTTYGGDGQTTFALPDLRGRIPVGTGNGPGLTPIDLGQVGGSETVTLTINQIPSHNHPAAMGASTNASTSGNSTGGVLAAAGQNIYSNANPTANMAEGAAQVGIAGSSNPHNNIMPVLALNYIIALEGIFPSRN